MTRAAFDALVDMLDPMVRAGEVQTGCWNSAAQSKRSSPRGRITTVLKVSAMLRWLAGGSYLDICGHHGISRTSFYQYRDTVLDAIEKY